LFISQSCAALFNCTSQQNDIVGVGDRKVDSGDYKPEDYRVLQSDGYRQRLGEMRKRLGFGCDIDTFKNTINSLPAGELLCTVALYQFSVSCKLSVHWLHYLTSAAVGNG